jgi:hypothetical protein
MKNKNKNRNNDDPGPRSSFIIFIIFYIILSQSFENSQSKSKGYDASRVGTAGRERVNEIGNEIKIENEIGKATAAPFRVFDVGPQNPMSTSIIKQLNPNPNRYLSLFSKFHAAFDFFDANANANASAFPFQ